MTVDPAMIQALPSGEFSEYSAAFIQTWIDRAVRRVNSSVYGDLTDDAVLLLAAHMISSLAKGSTGPGGPVTSETAGPLSRSYGSPSFDPSDGDFSSTTYGRAYIELRSELSLTPRVC